MSTREYVTDAANRYFVAAGLKGLRIYDSLVTDSDPAYPHMVIVQVGRAHDVGFEGSVPTVDTYRLDFRSSGPTIDEAELTRAGVILELTLGDRLVREGTITELIEGNVASFEASGNSVTAEFPVRRLIQEVEILI